MDEAAAELARKRAWHALAPDTVVAALDTRASGLTAAEAARRLARDGRNELPPPPRRPAWRRFLAQFDNLLIYVLLAAALVTLALGQAVDTAAIVGVVLINAVIGFLQEGKAERALQALQGLLAARTTVLRAGERHEIAAAELVVGDVVLLTAGDRVPADLRLLRARNLRVDEAPLTGESVPVDKGVDAVAQQAPLAERSSMLYAGTTVVFGQGTGVVVATGARTELGRIGALVSGVPELVTPLARKLDHFARRITAFIVIGSVAAFAYGTLVQRFGAVELFLALVGLAVAAIPEGLPAIVTIALAIGTQKMARRHAIVRRLPAVETLGSVTVILTDKTGTLTKNEMTVVQAILPTRTLSVSGSGYAPEGGFTHDGGPVDPAADAELAEFARCALLCNDAELRHRDGEWQLIGDPTEGALLTLALKAGLDPESERRAAPRADEIPFDAQLRLMATLHHDHRGHARVYLKGAPERVLPLCTHAGGAPLAAARWEAALAQAAHGGYRVLALAAADFPAGTAALSLADLTPRFTLLGVAAMIDPPRPEAVAAVAECQRAGVQVKMITGDHAATAAAVAKRLGLTPGEPLTGGEIDGLDEAQLGARLARTDVVARASPEHKLRLVMALQGRGEIVAMTGDGANDAPALKRADIGVAMGKKGTDAAKEAAAIVLADDNFATIANAVRQGRVIYDNIKKALLFILPTNGGQAGVILLAVLLGLAIPVTAAQILWVNMVTTVTLALALAFEPAEPGVMARPPRAPAEPLITPALLARIVYVSVLMVAAAFAAFEWELRASGSLAAARTATVNMIVIGELVYLFNVRHFIASSFARDTLTGNRVALGVSGVLILLQGLFTFAPPLQWAFATASLAPSTWGLIALAAAALFVAVEGEKAWLRRRGVVHI